MTEALKAPQLNDNEYDDLLTIASTSTALRQLALKPKSKRAQEIRTSLYSKLGASDPLEAVVRAARMKLFDPIELLGNDTDMIDFTFETIGRFRPSTLDVLDLLTGNGREPVTNDKAIAEVLGKRHRSVCNILGDALGCLGIHSRIQLAVNYLAYIEKTNKADI